MLEKYKKLEFEGFLLRIGYTQGELSEDFEDFDNEFNASKHCYWNFMILRDINEESAGNEYLLMNLNNSDVSCMSRQEEVSSKIENICNSQTEEMFGLQFPSSAFESVVLGAIDEPIDYDCINEVLENIGGNIEENYGTGIPKENVNSLFSYSMYIDHKRLKISENTILIDNKKLTLNEMYIEEPKLVYFSEDVMNYNY